jgi:beta-lactamase regulating signal transducer with metallopeptidase domain
MDLLWQVGVGNAVGAAVLAVPAVLASLISRRPALTHGLWLLVLLKLLTPPFYPVRLEWIEPQSSEPASAAPEPRPEESSQPIALIPDRIGELGAAVTRPGFAEPHPTGLAGASKPESVAEAAPERGLAEWISWQAVLAAIWTAGSAAWIALASLRFCRFHRLLRHAEPAESELAARTRRLAKALGLSKPPVLRLIAGRVSPMLWWLPGKASLILPRELIGRLTVEQCDALLTHELAHLRRRDHWVRVVEFLATGVFWWHPIVWWARREIREAEEQCCDAWVVWAMPAVVRSYALALVEAVDFLSEVRPALPPVASGIGYVHDLRRRLTMIMQGTTPRGLTWSGALLVLGLAAFMLPMLPTLAQSPPPAQRGASSPDDDVRRAEDDVQKARARLEQAQRDLRKKQETSEKAMKPEMRNEVCLRCHVNPHPAINEGKERFENLHDEIVKLSATADEQRAALRVTEGHLQAAMKKLDELSRTKEGKDPTRPDPRPGLFPGGPMAPDGDGPKQPPGGGRFPPEDRGRPSGGGPLPPPSDGPLPPDGKPGAWERGGRGGPEEGKRIGELQAELKKRMDLEKHNQDRIQELTNQVEKLMKEMERMRKEMRDRTPEKSPKEVDRPSGGAAPDDPNRREESPRR